jgi:hypothetical protein
MSTAEDVFSLYERNKLVYANCANKEQPCPHTWRGQSFCYMSEPVQPFTIGDQTVPCRLHVKCYLRPDQECPICLEKIAIKKDAFLTGCGHAFHRKCLFTAIEMKWKQKLYSVLKCPLCRTGLSISSFLYERYINSDSKKVHQLDQLENFWLTKDLLLPHYCTNRKSGVHYLGMKHSCTNCKQYRKKG